jgi:hypothetical protein
VLDVAYVGNVGRHLLHRRSLNATNLRHQLPAIVDRSHDGQHAPAGELPAAEPGYGDIQYIEMASTSNYHSLQTQLNAPLRRSLTFGGAWTWSKALTLVNGNNERRQPVSRFPHAQLRQGRVRPHA